MDCWCFTTKVGLMNTFTKVMEILNQRLHHHSIHNEVGKDIRINEVKILKLIIKDNHCHKQGKDPCDDKA